MKPKILTFGEIIWDVYENDSFIGGAGLNFAAHCARCGAESMLFSAVGRDELGKRAIDFVNCFGMSCENIKILDKPTGQCTVRLDNHGTPDFCVIQDVAYDNIPITDDDVSFINRSYVDALYFGTLIQRSAVSRASLKKLLSSCTFNEIVCDINLRKNCYDADSVRLCLENATVLKVSIEEEENLRQMDMYAPSCDTPEAVCRAICEMFCNIKYLLLTLGGDGALLYCSKNGEFFRAQAKKCVVASTVGAGDSFAAAWISSYLSGKDAKEATEIANTLASFVVSKTDAIPQYAFCGGKIIEKRPMLQAHRGVSTDCPENTMSAFCAAAELGYEYIELDPNYTSDKVIVVLHDKSINRTARHPDGREIEEKINIADITYSQALAYDYGIGFSKDFSGEKLPTLDSVLCLAKEKGVTVKIDNKIEKFPDDVAQALFDLVEKYGSTVALTSAKVDTIKSYAARFPSAYLHYDGPVDDEVLRELSPYSDRLTVWLPHFSPLTSWAKVPFADEKLCAKVKQVAQLGIWLIGDTESYAQVCQKYSPDIIETTGAIKP
ncbi:MAG: hypothetical protein E7656_03850 [Ruminococcaceae bacterium]|nr:hypothetical protein [Oscillospiraceae bacterium]